MRLLLASLLMISAETTLFAWTEAYTNSRGAKDLLLGAGLLFSLLLYLAYLASLKRC